MSELTRWESMSRWSRSKELEEMEKRLSRSLWRAPRATSGETKEAISVAKWSALVDITEDEKEYIRQRRIREDEERGYQDQCQ